MLFQGLFSWQTLYGIDFVGILLDFYWLLSLPRVLGAQINAFLLVSPNTKHTSAYFLNVTPPRAEYNSNANTKKLNLTKEMC